VSRKEKEGLSKTRKSNIASGQKGRVNGRRDVKKSYIQTSSGWNGQNEGKKARGAEKGKGTGRKIGQRSKADTMDKEIGR